MFSTYTPFFRRFTDEKGRELEETRQLYAWVRARQDAFEETPSPSDNAFTTDFFMTWTRTFGGPSPTPSMTSSRRNRFGLFRLLPWSE